MRALAIHLQHNATCAFMEKGVIKSVVSEEKFTNFKNDSCFPFKAISYLVETFNIQYLDAILICAEKSKISVDTALTGDPSAHPTLGRHALDNIVLSLYKLRFGWLHRHLQRIKFQTTKAREQRKIVNFLRTLDLPEFGDVLFYDHHDCHAFAAFGALRDNDERALVLTADGQGDLAAARVYIADKNGLTRVANTFWTNSLGELYGKVTQLLGMKQLEHEYKVMGLAPYVSNPDYYKKTKQNLFSGLLWVNENLTFGARYPTYLSGKVLSSKIAFHRFDNISAALQEYTEDLVLEWVKKTVAKTGIRTIYTGGGLFMNVKVNKRIQELEEVKIPKFMPSCGDESLPIGACYKFFFETTGEFADPLKNIYLGPSFSNDDIKAFVENERLADRYNIQHKENIEMCIAKLLADGQVVARFSGAAEWGARSLGNRAILARPDRMESFFMVNDQVKMRDFWMPFAPSILEEVFEDYIVAPRGTKAPFMITSFDSKPQGRISFCAAMHNRDKTLRAQIVEKSVNPKYHQLLRYFYELSGIGGVLNTSFNLHGFPLVCDPAQAIFTMDKCGLQYLALENYLLCKK